MDAFLVIENDTVHGIFIAKEDLEDLAVEVVHFWFLM